MATELRPLVRLNGYSRELPDGSPVNGTTNDINMVARQAGAALTLLSTDTVIDGSNYLWESILLPIGRLPYFEVVASGVNLGVAVGVTVGLYTLAGVLVPGSSLTITSINPQRSRSLALPLGGTTGLINNTEYVVRYKTGGLAGSAFVFSARILLR